MKLKGIYRTAFILLFLALNVGCDQVTKSMMREHIGYYDHYSFLDGHVTLLNVENKGAFLSAGDSLAGPLRLIILTLLPVAFLLGALVYIIIKNNMSNLALIGIICVIGGGIGNIYDRIVHGSVTDFMHLKFGIFQTGVFNAADVSIMTGMGLILLNSFLRAREAKKQEALEG